MAITVKNLIEELKNLDPNDFILLSSDPDGNDFNFLAGIGVNNKFYQGDIYVKQLTNDLIEQGYTDADVCADGVNCVVFYPSSNTSMLETMLASSTAKEE